MAESNKQPAPDLVDEFLDAPTHAARVKLFEKYPALHAAFRIAHFELLAEQDALVPDKPGTPSTPAS